MTDDPKPDSGFYFLMLNMDDDDLDPFEFRLLGHIRRRAGGSGVCFSKVKTIAKDTKMGYHKVQTALKNLHRKKRIRLQKQPGHTHKIIPLDRMSDNLERYKSTPSKNKRPSKNGRGIPIPDQDRGVVQIKTATPSKNGRPPHPDVDHKELPPVRTTHLSNNQQQQHAVGDDDNFSKNKKTEESPSPEMHEFLTHIGIEFHQKLRDGLEGASVNQIKQLWSKIISTRKGEKRKGAMARAIMDRDWKQFRDQSSNQDAVGSSAVTLGCALSEFAPGSERAHNQQTQEFLAKAGWMNQPQHRIDKKRREYDDNITLPDA